jgi:hypothetical protein
VRAENAGGDRPANATWMAFAAKRESRGSWCAAYRASGGGGQIPANCKTLSAWKNSGLPHSIFGPLESVRIRPNPTVYRIPQDPTPLSYIFETRSVGFLDSRPDTKCVPVRAFSDHKLIRFLDRQVSQKVVREQLGATALRATCGVRRGELRARGRSAPSRGLVRGGVGSSSRLQYQRLAVAAALRTLPVAPNSRHSPLKMGPRGSRGALAARRW